MSQRVTIKRFVTALVKINNWQAEDSSIVLSGCLSGCKPKHFEASSLISANNIEPKKKKNSCYCDAQWDLRINNSTESSVVEEGWGIWTTMFFQVKAATTIQWPIGHNKLSRLRLSSKLKVQFSR